MSDCKAVRVLLVDPHPIVLDGVRHAMRNTEFVVAGEATTGESAVDLARELRPELILLDLSLPGISGMEVLRRLTESGSVPYAVVFTAQITHEAMVEALQLGARGVLLKESPADMLLKSMRAVLSGEFWVGRQTMASLIDILREKPASVPTARERQIVAHVLDGMTNRQIASELGISEETVKRHLRNLYGKLGVSSRMELALRLRN